MRLSRYRASLNVTNDEKVCFDGSGILVPNLTQQGTGQARPSLAWSQLVRPEHVPKDVTCTCLKCAHQPLIHK